MRDYAEYLSDHLSKLESSDEERQETYDRLIDVLAEMPSNLYAPFSCNGHPGMATAEFWT